MFYSMSYQGGPKLMMASLYGATHAISCLQQKGHPSGSKPHAATGGDPEGETVCVITKHWMAVTASVNSLIQDINLALSTDNADEAELVLGMLDNSFFQARYKDDNYCPIRMGATT
jgi:hypothetical protein